MSNSGPQSERSFPTATARAELAAPRTGMPPPLFASVIDPLVDAALEEDLGGLRADESRSHESRHTPNARAHELLANDVTTMSSVPAGSRARGTLLAKQSGRLAGLDVFCRVFERLDPCIEIDRLNPDGAVLLPGTAVARVRGSAAVLLAAERTALNFVQRLSGIATQAARWVDLAGGRVRILDTRKTTPGLRALEKYAVRCGGAENHRFALYDEVLVKDNHIDLAGVRIADVLSRVRARVGPRMRISCEARAAGEAEAAIDGGADVVLLDNFAPHSLRELVPVLRAHASARGRVIELEASGGIDEHNLRAYAETGVDRISIGALTHSAPALDLSFKLERVA